MSLINEYRETQETIKRLQERLNNLSQDNKLKEELEFESKLLELMRHYGKSLSDVTALLDPNSRESKALRGSSEKATTSKRARRVKQYRNPHTGEVIETKGGNHTVLKSWKAQWGSDTVESWATLLG